MQNQDPDQAYQALISSYLSGNASDVQVRELEAWVAASPENKAYFMEMKKAWVLSGVHQESTHLDIEKAWRVVSTEVFDQGKVAKIKPISKSRRWLAIAASLLVLAVASFLFYQNMNASGALAMTTTNESKTIDLADGSQITLNQSSSLTYAPSEEHQQRNVTLIGDAFFDVARDEKRPFVIETKHLEIEVLGTSFYVDARDDENEVQVIVKSGKVAVRANGAETILAADEKVVFQKDAGMMVKQKNEDHNFTALTTNILVFENSSLSDVAFALNRQFNRPIQLNITKLSDCKLTSTFKNKSLDAILEIIKSSLGIDIRKSQNQIIFDGSCTLE